MSAIQKIKTMVTAIAPCDLLDLEQFASQTIQRQIVQVALTKRSQAVAEQPCIHCGLNDLMRWGHSKVGTQRFKCRNCKATFGATNNTPFFRLRNRHLWAKYLGLMSRHIPLKGLREEHGIALSIPTLHRWRHRFLTMLSGNPTTKLAGLIEADEKFFRTAYKGSRGFKRELPPQDRKARRRGVASQRGLSNEQVPTLTAIDRSGAIFQTGLPDMKWDTISETMAPWVEPESVICSDGNGAYARVAEKTGCDHVVAKKGGHNTTKLNIGRIDAYHRDVENLINRRCNGVSTRYLMNYFGWARRITQHKPFGGDLLGELLAA